MIISSIHFLEYHYYAFCCCFLLFQTIIIIFIIIIIITISSPKVRKSLSIEAWQLMAPECVQREIKASDLESKAEREEGKGDKTNEWKSERV